MKKLLMTSLVFLLVLTGCSGEKVPFANSDGTILNIKLEDAEPGYYVKSGDKLHPLLQQGLISQPKLMQWFKNYDQLIPQMQSGDEIIYIHDNKVPNSYEFTKMIDFGYTIGSLFQAKSLGGTDYNYTFSNISDNTSAVSGRVNSIDNSALISEINSIPFTKDLLTSEGLIRGLEKDGLYTIYYYVGTKYNEIQLKAESRVFVSDYSLTSTTYEKKKNIYFVIELPEDMDTGYYVLNDFGSFFYNSN